MRKPKDRFRRQGHLGEDMQIDSVKMSLHQQEIESARVLSMKMKSWDRFERARRQRKPLKAD